MDVVHPIIRVHMAMHIDRLGCIARLPEELLVRIFKNLPLWDRVRVAEVCQRWRTVSLGTVSLWSDIPHLQNVDTYEHLLARAGDCPVSLTYWPEDLDDLELFCYILARNLGRIKKLRFILPERREEDDDDDDESLDASPHLHGVLSGNAPILESLALWDLRGIFSRAYSSLPLLESPLLRVIELYGFHPSYLEACANSPVLQTLTMSPPETYDRFLAEDWSRLTQFATLETLSLQLPGVLTAHLPSQSPRLSQSLQHLYLRVHPEVFEVLAHIEDLSRLQTVDISFVHRHTNILGSLHPNRLPHVPWLAALLPFVSSTTVSAAVHFGGPWFSLRAEDSAGRTRVFRDVNVVDGDWHSLLSGVTRLWLDAYTVIPAAPAPAAAFPALEELTLGTTRPTVFAFGGAPSRVQLAWPPLSCPRLRTVRVVSETERQIVDLPAREVLDYLARTCPRLGRLVFDGITLTPDPGAALDAVAESVEMVQSAKVPPESYSVWAHPWGNRAGF